MQTECAAALPTPLARLNFQRRNPAGYALLFLIFFRCWVWTEGENKYTFNIKARQYLAT
jgi:hypothetical protein